LLVDVGTGSPVGGGDETVTVTLAVPVTLPLPPVAVPVYLPALEGAVYSPLLVILPPFTLHETVTAPVEPSLNVPLAVNCCVLPAVIEALAGLTVMPVSVGAGAVTVTVLESATLPWLATTRYAPAEFPAA